MSMFKYAVAQTAHAQVPQLLDGAKYCRKF